ncbi:hypothetical protein [Aurantiacibacter gangjinensis]|uniref:Uncharacterized protein n=1 Tax=Aurantiacibacter gangjinensis TaxID=502682 RepID=A0A0G9MRU6_9SPHN|nr:hypothetical protein [Aurantiacibacter gangjinensis]APE29208.1 hypothetical protein BMF35_a2379 [Aurantiacibacter gangjinensis]KLE33269.1 hypothetical protein AAW01_04765 [Aurantiacibacter gangjinensis]
MKGPLSLRNAALVGFIFASAMCVWRFFTSDDTTDEVLIRFAVYFAMFTTGFWIIVNLIATKRSGDK